MSILANQMAAWIRQQTVDAGARGVVVGLSGGVDSAVVARVAQLAMGDAVLAVIMPAHSDPQDERDAGLVADHFKIRAIRVDLAAVCDGLLGTIRQAQNHDAASSPTPAAEPPRLAVANLKPRLRMTTLYAVANWHNYVVAGTGNRSEISIGYYTKYGDGGVDLLPLGSLVKSEVRALARELGVPQIVIDKVPSAGLWLGQTDESEMGFTYDVLERFLNEGPASVAPPVAARIAGLVRVSDHKRQMPPVFKPNL